MKNVNIEELVKNIPTMDLAKALVTSFLEKHPHTIKKAENEAAYNLMIWIHDDIPTMEVPEITVEVHNIGEGFTRIETDWSEWNELSKRANESL